MEILVGIALVAFFAFVLYPRIKGPMTPMSAEPPTTDLSSEILGGAEPTVENLMALDRAALLNYAAAVGVETKKSWTKKQIVDAILAS